MIKHKKAMSDVVTTLIIILLAIVAIGIIWMVVKNLLGESAEQVELGAKCKDVEIQATKITNLTSIGTSYELTLSRTGAGEEIGGVKVVLFNDTSNSDVIDFGEAVNPLDTVIKTLNLTASPVIDADKVEMTVYFISDLGEEQVCSTTATKEF